MALRLRQLRIQKNVVEKIKDYMKDALRDIRDVRVSLGTRETEMTGLRLAFRRARKTVGSNSGRQFMTNAFQLWGVDCSLLY